jgi:hypothetical protein
MVTSVGAPHQTRCSPPDLIVLAGMTVEVSRDTLRASRLARELRESEAAAAIRRVEVDRLPRMLHPDDIESMRSVLREATAFRDEREVRVRIVRPDGSVRRIAAVGRSTRRARVDAGHLVVGTGPRTEPAADRARTRTRGVTADTRRHSARRPARRRGDRAVAVVLQETDAGYRAGVRRGSAAGNAGA